LIIAATNSIDLPGDRAIGLILYPGNPKTSKDLKTFKIYPYVNLTF
jgi:hypothetical protein